MLKTGKPSRQIMTNSIRIDYHGMRPYLQEAVIKVNELFRTEQFYDNIASHHAFDMADTPPQTIAVLMRKASLDMYVDLYYSMSPIKNIDGYDDMDTPSLIHINIWKLDRPVASICNTLVHSCVHAVNAYHNQYYFGHGNEPVAGKENTAPYRIGAIAQHMIAKEEIPFTLEHDVLKVGQIPIRDFMPAIC